MLLLLQLLLLLLLPLLLPPLLLLLQQLLPLLELGVQLWGHASRLPPPLATCISETGKGQGGLREECMEGLLWREVKMRLEPGANISIEGAIKNYVPHIPHAGNPTKQMAELAVAL